MLLSPSGGVLLQKRSLLTSTLARSGGVPRVLFAVIAIALVLCGSILVPAANASSAQAVLGSHWVLGWGFRDELNGNDTDYQNFWTDNAGKILTASLTTNDAVDASRALWFVQDHVTDSCYLPEALVNSSMTRSGPNVSNRIVNLQGDNQTSDLQRLTIGDYYAGPWPAGYLGADRIWFNGSAHRALSTDLSERPNGYVDRAYFSFSGLSFYTYLNATIAAGNPYVTVSVQVEPLNSSFGPADHTYLQVFANATSGSQYQYAFENATFFDSHGNFVGAAPFNNATHPISGRILVAYSNRTSTLTQDSIALRFNSTGLYDAEHWYHDGAFDNLSWVGLGYNVPMTGPGELSAPVYAEVYPIQHLDFRLLSDTMKYVALNLENVTVSPPVSFGFVAEGLAMESNLNPGNQTRRTLARTCWNFYYDRYEGTELTTTYPRAVNVFALAGFELYGGNGTVESFTRDFVGKSPGLSIEEYGWAAAALWTLYAHTRLSSDLLPYQRIVGSFVAGGISFLDVNASKRSSSNSTFQFGEAASGELIGRVPYNSSSVLWAMNAVLQSNSSGGLLNKPINGDEANTETIPAYMMSTWLFQNAVRNSTGYWVTSLHDVNMTSMTYTDGILTVKLEGADGTFCLTTPGGNVTCNSVNGAMVLRYGTSGAVWYWVLPLGAISIVVAIVVVWRLRNSARLLLYGSQRQQLPSQPYTSVSAEPTNLNTPKDSP
jgi:hypothetical protein